MAPDKTSRVPQMREPDLSIRKSFLRFLFFSSQLLTCNFTYSCYSSWALVGDLWLRFSRNLTYSLTSIFCSWVGIVSEWGGRAKLLNCRKRINKIVCWEKGSSKVGKIALYRHFVLHPFSCNLFQFVDNIP